MLFVVCAQCTQHHGDAQNLRLNSFPTKNQSSSGNHMLTWTPVPLQPRPSFPCPVAQCSWPTSHSPFALSSLPSVPPTRRDLLPFRLLRPEVTRHVFGPLNLNLTARSISPYGRFLVSTVCSGFLSCLLSAFQAPSHR